MDALDTLVDERQEPSIRLGGRPAEHSAQPFGATNLGDHAVVRPRP